MVVVGVDTSIVDALFFFGEKVSKVVVETSEIINFLRFGGEVSGVSSS
jgi:hypothetical protein